MLDFEDKDLAIITLTIIALAIILWGKTADSNIVSNIVCGIAGIVTGRAIEKNNKP